MKIIVAAALAINPTLFKKVEECKTPAIAQPNAKVVAIVKQWHLSPGMDTKLPMKKPALQTDNLIEIEKQLSEWVEKKQIQSLIAEGCEGALTDSAKFNGWTLAELRAKAKDPSFSGILTHPGMKLEARFADALDTRCGDDEKAIREETLAFSDARASLGYSLRIQENKNDAVKLKPYLEGVREAYHLPADATADQALVALKKDLVKSVEQIRALNLKRSKSLARAAIDSPGSTAILAGGMHVKEIKTEIEAAKLPCMIVEPLHYGQDEEKLLSEMEKRLK